MKPRLSHALLALTLPTAAACQSPAAQVRSAAVYPIGVEVTFEGFTFELAEVSAGPSYDWNDGFSTVTSGTGFVCVELTTTNAGPAPVPVGLQPVVSLVDGQGRVFESSLQHSIQLNYPEPTPGFGSMNPGVPRRWTHVFEAPPNHYRVRILAPSRAAAGFMNGSVHVTGPFFFYDAPQSELAAIRGQSASGTAGG